MKRLLILALLCTSVWGQVGLVNKTDMYYGAGGTYTFTRTGIVAGNWVVVPVALEDEQTLTLTDSHSLFNGESPVVIQQCSPYGGAATTAIFAKLATVSGDYTFTLTASAGTAHTYASVLQFSNVLSLGPTGSTCSTSAQSLALTTSSSNAMLVGVFLTQGSTTIGSGFTSNGSAVYGNYVAAEYTTPPPSNSAGSNAVAFTTAGWTGSFVALSLYPTTPTVATPTFDHPMGTYIASSLVVTPSTVTPSAHVCTRTDGTAPTATAPGTCDSPAQTDGTVTLSTGSTTVKSLGTDAGYSNSAVATATYNLVAAGPSVPVSVIGTTATQAVLKYTAPDSSACSVAISESATFVPLVPDVDPTMFSNLDSRAGSVSIGLSRIFVAGTRDVQTGLDSSPHSRALQAATRHYFRVTCGMLHNSFGDGAFMTQTIPVGLGWADPIPINPANDGTYIYPRISTTDRTATIVDPHTGALIKNLTLPGDLAGGITAAMRSEGIGIHCHPTPVLASDEAKYGYHCQIDLVSGTSGLYWIASDGETRFLGTMRTDYTGDYNGQDCRGDLSASFNSITNPNSWGCVVSDTSFTKKVIVQATYAGHSVPGNDTDLTGVTPTNSTPHTTFSLATPMARDLLTLLPEFDPRFSAANCCIWDYSDWANSKLIFYFVQSSQDTIGWIAQFDPARTPAQQTTQFGNSNGCIDNPPVTGSMYTGQTGCVIASTGTWTGGQESGFRWNTLHTVDVTPASALVPMTLNPTGADYQVTLTSALSATPATCSMSQPVGNTLANWPDTGWTMGCSTIHVVGDPTYTGAHAGYPASIPALPGDLLSVNGGDYSHNEIIRLLYLGSDGLTWYVQRQWYYRQVSGTVWPNEVFCEGWQTASCLSVYSYSSASIGGTLAMLPATIYPSPNITGTTGWWDTVAGALTTTSANMYRDTLQQGHPAFINNSLYGRWTYAAGMAISGQEPGRIVGKNCEVCLDPPPGAITMGLPKFNGLSEETMETHTSLSVSNPPNLGTYQQIVDNRPYYGDRYAVTSAMVTNVSGQLYRIRGAAIASNYKQIGWLGYSGFRVMKETSGPGVTMTTDAATQYRWCFAVAAGECYAGSLAGDVYFNSPSVVDQYCSTNTYLYSVPNDICVVPLSSAVQSVVMQEIGQDVLGKKLRVITNALSGYQAESIFWNSRTLPDASWLFTSFVGNPNNVMLVKIPPRLPATVDGTAYYVYSVVIPATAGVVTVEFGYAENGDPTTSLNCTSRNEPCVALTSTVGTPPFWFKTSESGSYSGVSCTSGCTVAIPAMPGRVLYYRTVVAGTPGPMQAVPLGMSAMATYSPVFGRGVVLGRRVVR